MKTGLLKEREGWRYYGAAVTYAVLGYGLGIAGLFSPTIAINFAATLLLAHAMTIAATRVAGFAASPSASGSI